MLRALNDFESRIAEIKAFGDVYTFLENRVAGILEYSDILRSQIVYAVSAYDALLHEIIRQGMCDSYEGRRIPTAKFNAEALTIGQHLIMTNSSLPPASVQFEIFVRGKLKSLSFQHPDKVCDGLSLIWSESHKWDKISAKIGVDPKVHRTQQTLWISRRNAIVHEYDFDPVSSARVPVSEAEATEAVEFFLDCGTAIVELVA